MRTSAPAWTSTGLVGATRGEDATGSSPGVVLTEEGNYQGLARLNAGLIQQAGVVRADAAFALPSTRRWSTGGGSVCERSAHSAPRPAQLRAAGPLPKLPVPGRLLEPPPTRNRQGRACHRFRANEARLLLGVIAYNLAIWYNALPLAIQGWSL